jgi:hypothetical protein
MLVLGVLLTGVGRSHAQVQVQPPYSFDFNGADLPTDAFWDFSAEGVGRSYMTPGEVVSVVSATNSPSTYEGGNRYRGNVLRVTNQTTLAAMDVYLERSGYTQIDFAVYEANASTSSFQRIARRSTTANPGTGYVASGTLDVVLEAGKTYWLGASWDESTSYRAKILAFSSDVPIAQGVWVGNGTGNGHPMNETLSGSIGSAAYDVRYRFVAGRALRETVTLPLPGTGSSRTRGLFLDPDGSSPDGLSGVAIRLGRSAPVDVTFRMYASATSNGTFNLVASNRVTAAAGTNYVSSGSFDLAINETNFYLLTASWDESATYYYNFGGAPVTNALGVVYGALVINTNAPSNTLVNPGVNDNLYDFALHGTEAGAVRMDSAFNTLWSTNRMDLAVDLAGMSNVTLSFRHRASGEEGGNEGFYMRGSTTSAWQQVETFPAGTTDWQTYTVDLAATAADLGFALTDEVGLRWQQADNFSYPDDGRDFDDILLAAPPDLRMQNVAMDIVGGEITMDVGLLTAVRGTNQPIQLAVSTDFALHGGTNDLEDQAIDLRYLVNDLGLTQRWQTTQSLTYDLPAFSEQWVTVTNLLTVPAGTRFQRIAIETVHQLDPDAVLTESVESNNEANTAALVTHYSGRLWFGDAPTEIWVTNWITRTAFSSTNHTISGTGMVKGLSFSFTDLDVDKDLNTLDYYVAPGETQVVVTTPLLSATVNQVAYRAPGGIRLSRTGAEADLIVTLPAGLGWRNDANGHVLESQVSFNAASLAGDPLDPDGEPESFAVPYIMEETKPLFFGVSSLTWIPRNGAFEAVSDGALQYVRADELNELSASAVSGWIPLDEGYRRSNEQFYNQAKIAPGETLTVWADDNGAAELTVDLALEAGDYRTHMPYDVEVAWGSGSLGIADDLIETAISASALGGVTNLMVSYVQGCPGDCPGSGTESAISLTPTDDQLQFAGNGGVGGAGGLVGSPTVAWGYIPNLVDFAQQVNGATTGAFFAAGHFLRGDQLPAELNADDAPGVILYSGVARDAERTPERPWAASYVAGLGDYPGLNIRHEAGMEARSVVGGEAIEPYALTSRSKYYLRTSGVSGIHEADSFPGEAQIYGYDFAFLNYGLNYLSSSNRDSRTEGSVAVPYPSDFVTDFEELRFSCLGDLLDAQLADAGAETNLVYWNAPFVPLTIGFERNATCDAGSGFLAMNVQTWADHVEDLLFGKLGFTSNGTLLAASDAVTDIDSRLSLPSSIPVAGPQAEVYTLFPVNEAYFNDYDNAKADTGVGQGFISLAGTLDVTFFEDLLVQAHTGAGTNGNSSLYLIGGWPDQGWTDAGDDFFNHSRFDEGNWGYPAGVAALSVADYRAGDQAQYQVRARRTWLNVIEFSYPLTWSTITRSFRSASPEQNDLMVLQVEHQVDYLSAENAELSFGVQYDGLPRINIANFVVNQVKEATGVASAFANSVGDEVMDTLEGGLNELDRLLNDTAEELLEEVLVATIDPVVDALYDELQAEYVAGTDWYNDSIDRLIAGIPSGGPVPVTNLTFALDSVMTGFGEAHGVLDEVDAALESAIRAIDAVAGQVTIDPATGAALGEAANGLIYTQVDGAYPQLQELTGALFEVLAASLFASLGGELEAAVNEQLERLAPALESVRTALTTSQEQLEALRDQLQAAEAFSRELEAQLDPAVVDQLGLDIAAALKQRLAEELSTSFNPFEEYSAADFKQLIRDEIRVAVMASEIPPALTAVLRARLYDLDAQVRQSVDSVFQQVNSITREIASTYLAAVDDSINGFLDDLSDVMGAGKIDGYAHIRGDALQRLRLDGSFQWEVPEELEFSAFLLIEQLDTSGTGGCSFEGGTANSVTIGAASLPCNWLASDLKVDVSTKFTFHNGGLVGMAGAFEFAEGGISFESFEIPDLGAAVAFGLQENYLSANARAIFSGTEVAGGVFFGRTCTLDPIEMIDPDVAGVLGTPPFSGAYVYGEAWIPIVDFGCVFNVSAAVGAGVFYFVEGPTYGAKMLLGAKGEALCVVTIRGEVALVGVKSGGELSASGRGTLSGKAGACPFCVKFNKSVKVTYRNGSWDVDY